MPLVELKLPPGMYRSGTDYQSKGRWRSGNLVRFLEGRIEPVGGWVNPQSIQLDGPGRGIHTWRANTAGRFCGIGTIDKLWVYDGDAEYDITPVSFPAGNVNSAAVIGYGSGLYNAGNYGSSASGGRSEATTWSLDNFGEHLVACASHDGDMYIWTLATGTPAAAISGAPTARSLFVTAERFLVALGADGDPRKVQWADQETTTTWTPSSTNQAGDILIQTEGQLLTGLRTRGQSLLLTTTDAHTMRYVGPDAVYSFQRVGEACGAVGSNAATVFNGGAVWMGQQSFFLFQGTSVVPLPCEVADYVFTSINRDELALVSCSHRAQFGEVWWHYPSEGSLVNDRYVVWNYRENHWTLGVLERSCMVDAGVFDYPLGTDENGYLLEHENGWTDAGAARAADVFLESGPIEVGSGDRVMSLVQIVPDEVTAGAFRLRLATKFTPEGAAFTYGPYTLTPYTDVRVTGRQVAIQIEGVRDEDARIGTFRGDVREGGRR